MNIRKILNWALALCCAMFSACMDELESVSGNAGNGNGWAVIEFGHTSFDKVQITTRSSLGEIPESRVQNLYVYVFDKDGNRVYGHFFDMNNKVDNIVAQNSDCWTVTNKQSEKADDQTRGKVRIKAPAVSGGKLCVLANVDADMLNFSPEKLNLVHSLAELEALQVTLNQETTSRNGRFPMTGRADDITITQDKGLAGFTQPLELRRLDAKVEVRVRVAEGNESKLDDGATQTLTGFIPESWQVVNIPRGSFIMERQRADGNDGHDAAAELGYFDSEPTIFESSATEDFTYTNTDGQSVTVPKGKVHGFSFYMLENRPAAKGSVGTNFHLRDTRIKDSEDHYDTSDGLWQYAPEAGTYLILRGSVEMSVSTATGVRDQVLNASVAYYIHLGNFKENLDDYSVCRNTHYTYTVTIKGVKNIMVEVSTKQENESGATGNIYVAREAICTFDAHYGQRVFAFDQESIEPDKMTWYVSTPFGREGMPDRVNGVEVPSGLDYKWVEFMLHKLPAEGQPYDHKNRWYNPKETMDVMAFCAYIRRQKRLFDAKQPNDFRPEIDEDLRQQYPNNPEYYTRYRIYATVFVNEFYYDSDPISGEKRPALWKEFVNRPNRTMHILSETRFSPDGASSATGSVVTILQRSIQTVYNVNEPSLTSAWGSEVTDELEGKLWFYSANESHATLPNGVVKDWGNTSENNGLYNTVKIWELQPGVSKWADYLDYEKENDTEFSFLKENNANLKTSRYAIMMRNRDNNGNGVIDAEEVRWYIASTQQLAALYVGDQGIIGDAQLYDQRNQYRADETDTWGGYKWRSHVISSTQYPGKTLPTMIWAEEGFSTSAYREYATGNSGKPGHYSVRCVRNLGMDPASETEAREKLKDMNNLPDKSIDFSLVSGSGADAVYRFDLHRVNSKSLRYYTSHDLEPTDEHAEPARTYSAFETGPVIEFEGNYLDLKEALERGESPCPEGYRIPNIREAALMSNYIKDNAAWWGDGYYYVSSYYSFGDLGKGYDPDGCISWYFKGGHITVAKPATVHIRTVRDVR